MDCEIALELLSASLDGALTPEEEIQLRAHLDRCPDCRTLRAELAELHAVCGEMDVLPPAQLKERILRHLPPQRPAGARHWRRWGAIAAALAVVVLAAWRLPGAFYQEPHTMDTAALTDDSRSIPAAGSRSAVSDSAPRNAPTLDASAQDNDADLPEAAAPDDLAEASDERPEGGRSVSTQLSGETPGPTPEPVKTDAAVYSNLSPGGAVTIPNHAAMTQAADAGAAPEDDLLPVTAAPSEAESSDDPDLSRYSAVIILTEGGFEGGYPGRLQENGELWYLLPLSALEDVSQALGPSAVSYELRREGDDLTPDAPYVLLIVPAEP